MNIRNLSLVATIFSLALSAAAGVRTEGAALGEWTQDVDAAKALAQKEGKYLFMNFTGSDWCGWCKLMDEHVFSQPGWQAWAKENLALAFVDRPKQKDLVPEKYRARNKQLAKDYNVDGFPTFVMFGPDGHEAGRLGASRGGNDYNFITNVIAVIVEDKIAEYVTPEELAEYRAAQQEKTAWEAKNGAAQGQFRKEFAEPYQKAKSDMEVENLALLKKGTDAWRVAVKPNEAAKGCEIQFSDFGRGVVTNGARFGAWTSSYGQAMKLAQETDKDLLIAFVGPKWCDWGNQMESNVFNTVEWMNFAKEHFVLVYIDCPSEDAAYMPEKQLTQNARLYKAYEMRGCPFYLLTDANGKRYDAFGATTGITPAEQIQMVEVMLAKKNLAKWLAPADYTAYTNLVSRHAALDAKWRRDYDAFIEKMDEHAEEFAPIAEKRNRVFTKALDAHLKAK